MHILKQDLQSLAFLSRQNPHLKIIARFFSILELLVKKYEYAGVSEQKEIKNIILQGLECVCSLIDGTQNSKDGAQILSRISHQAREKLQPFLAMGGFLCEPDFIEQTATELHKDTIDLRKALKENNKNKAIFLFKLIKDSFVFVGMADSAKLTETAENILYALQDVHLKDLNLQAVLDFFLKESLFLAAHKDKSEEIINHLESLNTLSLQEELRKYPVKKSVTLSEGLTLSSEEVSALMDESTEHRALFTALNEKSEPYPISILKEQKSRTNPEDEDLLVKLAGKLFLKQELLKSLVPKETKLLAGDKLESIEALTRNLKEKLFKNYYVSIKDLLGKDLRDFIQSEIDHMGKKVRLTIKGENSEILSRESDFVKDIVFDLVGISLKESIETPVRRTAIDKSETARLLIEFQDTGGEFEIQVRDDGKGLSSSLYLENLRKKIEAKDGELNFQTEENEYLKIDLHIPMKKILTKSILTRCGVHYLLLPTRCVQKIISIDSPENPALTKDGSCLGQISLSALISLEKSPTKMALICVFGEETIVYTVEEVIGEVEALVEENEVPLPYCAAGAVILNNERVGFLLDEKLLYNQSTQLLENRNKTLQKLH